MTESERILYLAVPLDTFETFFQENFIKEAVKLYQVKLIVYDPVEEADLAQDLVEMGIPKEDIILGLHPSYKRPYTGYSVA